MEKKDKLKTSSESSAIEKFCFEEKKKDVNKGGCLAGNPRSTNASLKKKIPCTSQLWS